MGVLLLTLVATMTLFVAEPDRAHAQTLLSPDATLNLYSTVVGGPSINNRADRRYVGMLDPTFDIRHRELRVRIGFNDSGVRVTPTAAQGQLVTTRI